jgi:hypothetical protein
MRTIAVCLTALASLFAQDLLPQGPTMPEVGKPAPEFRLNTHEGVSASIGGKSETWTVVAFFPKAATPG